MDLAPVEMLGLHDSVITDSAAVSLKRARSLPQNSRPRTPISPSSPIDPTIDQVSPSFPCMDGNAAGDSLGVVSNQPNNILPVSGLKSHSEGGTFESRLFLARGGGG